jgi:hypothetical protein
VPGPRLRGDPAREHLRPAFAGRPDDASVSRHGPAERTPPRASVLPSNMFGELVAAHSGGNTCRQQVFGDPARNRTAAVRGGVPGSLRSRHRLTAARDPEAAIGYKRRVASNARIVRTHFTRSRRCLRSPGRVHRRVSPHSCGTRIVPECEKRRAFSFIPNGRADHAGGSGSKRLESPSRSCYGAEPDVRTMTLHRVSSLDIRGEPCSSCSTLSC